MRGVVFRLLVVTWACVLLVLAPTGMEVQLKVLTRFTGSTTRSSFDGASVNSGPMRSSRSR